MGRSLLEDFLDCWPSRRGTSRHERRTITRAFLTTRNTRTDEKETLSLELLGAANRVWVVRVAAVDDDVALLEVRDELLDESVDSGTSLNEEDDLARALQLLAKLLDAPGALNVRAFATVLSARERLRGFYRGLPFASFSRKASTLLVVRL